MIGELAKTLKIKPRDKDIYITALTHSSYANENETENNEKLEFLGDAVIQLITSENLFRGEYKDEGELTKTRAQLVREEALVIYAKSIDLGSYMRLGKGEKSANDTMLGDCFEALMGAIYLDLGINETKRVFKKIITPHRNLVSTILDHKTQLQELVQAEKNSLVYKIVNTKGPSNNREFTAEVYLDSNILLGNGRGGSKKEAEQNAAKSALEKLAVREDFGKKRK